MADPHAAGDDVSAGAYKCTNCGSELHVQSSTQLTRCPNCRHGEYETVRGADGGHPHPSR